MSKNATLFANIDPRMGVAYNYHWHNKSKVVTAQNISLEYDHHLNEVKRTMHKLIGTPYTPPRSMGKGTTEFQFGGFVPENGSAELTVSQYMDVIADNIERFNEAQLRSLALALIATIPTSALAA